MKKFALLLAIVMVLSVFVTACQNDSGTDASQASSEVSEESSKESETSKPIVEKPASVVNTGVAVPENPNYTLVSGGAAYTKTTGSNTVDADEAYPDTYGTELTDGVSGEAMNNFSDETLSGYKVGPLYVNVDLGKVYDNLTKFTVSYFSTPSAGISVPGNIYVYASLDGQKWELVDADPSNSKKETLTKPDAVEGVVQTAELVLKQYVKAQYIRFAISKSGAWLFLDEVSVYADIEATDANVEFLDAVNSAYQQLGAIAAPSDGEAVNRDLEKVLVSKGCSYTTDGTTDSNFADNGNMLTDGRLSGYYEGETWVGFKGGEDITITLNLGRTVKDVASIEASFYVNTTIKLYMPVAVKVTALDNKKNRTDLGIIYGNSIIENGDYRMSLPLSKSVTARYIELTFVATDCSMHLVEEIAVYAYRAEGNSTLYPDLVIEEGATEWGSEGNSEYVNLILNQDVQIVADSDPGQDAYSDNTDVTSDLLTDGKYSASTEIHNGKFFKFRAGGGRKVLFDLQHLSYVDKFVASFTRLEDWAVHNPDTVTVFLSDDGTSWYEAGIMTLTGNGANDIYKGELVLDKAISARYVVFSFLVGGWSGCDELEVYGKKTSSGAVSPESAGLQEKILFSGSRMEPSEDLLGGSKDLCLLYHTNTSDAYKVEDLIPYLAYVDKDGVPQDVMFDSFLFLYNNNQFPSGGYPYERGLKSDWEWTLNDLFTEGEHIMALEEAAGQVKDTLNLGDDFKYKVTMTIYYPSTDTANFGDVDGDGVSENFANYADRIKAIKWYIDEVEKRFAEANFENIELVGYYWYHEEIVMKDGGSSNMINDTADLVHATGRDFYWIPWFCAPGYNEWSEYGFDIAVMQPNYVFDAESEYSKVVTCAKLTELYGMGIEMEICADALRNELFFKKYMQYLAGGVEYGYMEDAVNMYYQSTFIYRDAANSDDVMARTVYDTTYHYIKGDLQYKPDALNNLSFDATKNEVFKGTLEFDEEKLREFETYITADHGSVTFNADGTFYYYPEKDYTGEVTFSFIYSEYLGWSDPCEVTINVQ